LAASTQSQSQCRGLVGIVLENFSNLQRLLRVTGYCLKFIKRELWSSLSVVLQQKFPHLVRFFSGVSATPGLSSGEFNIATLLWVKHIQASVYTEVLEAIQNRRKHGLVVQLDLRLDCNGILRTHSRFANADLSDDARFPALLPKNNHFSYLVVLDIHNQLKHSGVSFTLNELRQKYWIPQGRQYVRKVVHGCIFCLKYRFGPPFELPYMPDWPVERVSKSVPFQFVGIDYFGHVRVKIGDQLKWKKYGTRSHLVKVGGKIHKMWVCLYTCIATRAVHLEPVTDATSPEFLKCLIRFVSRRGCPEQIISDNAAQFQLTSILSDRAWRTTPTDPNILSYSAKSGIKWKFIVQLAPWQGGHYERLVGIVKSVLKTATARRLLSWTDFITLLAETEAIVNSRPIAYVDNDIDNPVCALRPIDFLISRPSSLPVSPSTDVQVDDLGDGGKHLVATSHMERARIVLG
jgi:hypothetical protein